MRVEATPRRARASRARGWTGGSPSGRVSKGRRPFEHPWPGAGPLDPCEWQFGRPPTIIPGLVTGTHRAAIEASATAGVTRRFRCVTATWVSSEIQPPHEHTTRSQLRALPIVQRERTVRHTRHVYDERQPRTAPVREKLQVRTVWQSRPGLGVGMICAVAETVAAVSISRLPSATAPSRRPARAMPRLAMSSMTRPRPSRAQWRLQPAMSPA